MNPVELIRLEAELEYGVSIHGDAVPITPENTVEVPSVSVAWYSGGYIMHFRADMSEDLRSQFARISAETLFAAREVDLALSQFDVERVVHCNWYCITRIPDPAEFPEVVLRDNRFVVERRGQIAASAWSAQNDLRAAEVEVETAEAFRRQGFGRQVVAAWAYYVRREGKIALYSHLATNDASRALAASVGAWKYAETREYF